MVGVFLAAIRHIKNWPAALLEYAGRCGTATFTYRFRSGPRLTIRSGSRDDRAVVKGVWLRRVYGSGDEIPENSTVVDLGAQIGSFSVFAATRANKVRVIAVEPFPDNFALLQSNVSRNGLQGIVTPAQLAISDVRGPVTMFVDKGTVGHTIVSELLSERGAAQGGHISVNAVTLADLFDRYSIERCALLKVDIEGAEYPALYGAPQGLFARIDRIYIEAEDVESMPGCTREALMRFLIDMGYRVEHRPPFLYAVQAHL